MGSSQSRQKSALSSTQKMKVGFSWQTSQRGRLLAPAAASQRLAPAVASCVGAPRPRPGSTLGGRVLAAAEAASWRLNRVPGSARRKPRPGGGVLAASEAATWLNRVPGSARGGDVLAAAAAVEAASWRRRRPRLGSAASRLGAWRPCPGGGGGKAGASGNSGGRLVCYVPLGTGIEAWLLGYRELFLARSGGRWPV